MGKWGGRYVGLLRSAVRSGQSRGSRDGETLDLGPYHAAFEWPEFELLRGRGGSSAFARAEQLCYLAGEPPDVLTAISPRYARYRVRGEFRGAYGPRLLAQLPAVVDELERRPDSRRAVAQVYERADLVRALDDEAQTEDIPCTTGLHFWRNPPESLNVHAVMRSTDLWFGLYYDVPAFHAIQRAVAYALRCSTGPTFFTTTSLHLYKRHLPKAVGVYADTIETMSIAFYPVSGDSAVDRMLQLQAWCMQELAKLPGYQGPGRRIMESSGAATTAAPLEESN